MAAAGIARRSARAVAEVQRRRLLSPPRLIHTQRDAKEDALRQVEQKKEELYDALVDARQYLPGRPDMHLLKSLSLNHSRCPRFWEEYRASQIRHKKQELYNLIAQAEAESAMSDPDGLMLMVLCTQIEPRPYDPQWCMITKAKKILKWIMRSFLFLTAGGFTLYAYARPTTIKHEGYLYTAESVPKLVEQGSLPESVLKKVK